MTAFKFSPNLALQLQQRDQAVEFYQKVMGLEMAGQENDSIALRAEQFTIWFDKGEFLGPIFEFLVPNLEEAKERLLAEECQVLRWEGKGKPCYLRDPFGFVFNLYEDPEAF